jgi:hypothetical protein
MVNISACLSRFENESLLSPSLQTLHLDSGSIYHDPKTFNRSSVRTNLPQPQTLQRFGDAEMRSDFFITILLQNLSFLTA